MRPVPEVQVQNLERKLQSKVHKRVDPPGKGKAMSDTGN